ncbi:MAG TPA: AsmA family protein [Burkholderiales bacterium]|nr:AsmA family protein [Burkholderiales bacterium]
MKKFIKYTLYSLLGIVAVVAIAVVLLVTVVNPNRFKPFIVKAVYQSTGRTIALDGDISWKIYPNLGVNIKQVTLSNPSGFSESNFMTLNSADVSVGLIPLLSNHIAVKTLAIDGLNLALIKQNGVNNWTFTPPNQESSTAGTEGGKPQPLRLEMSAFSFTNATLSYADRDLKQSYSVKNANLIVDTDFRGGITFDQGAEQLSLNKVKFKYNDSAQGKLNFEVKQFDKPIYSGDVAIDKLALNTILDQFNIATKQRHGMSLLDNVVFSGNINGDINNLTLKDFKFNLSDKFKGNVGLSLKNFVNPVYNGNLDLEKFNLNQLLNSLNIAVAERKNKPLLNSFAISSNGFSGDKNNISLKGLKISAGDSVSASFGSLQVKNFTKPSVIGDVTIPTFNLNKTLDGLGIAMAERKNKPLLNSLAFSGSFNANQNSANLSNVKLSVGDSLKAAFSSLQIQNFANPSVSGAINLSDTNLNKVLDGLGIAIAERKNKPLLNSFAINTSFKATPNSVNLNGANFKFGTLLSGSTTVAVQNFANPKYSGSINLPTFSLNGVMQQLGMTPPDISNKTLLNQVMLNTSFSGSMNAINLSQLRAKIANSTATGSVNVSSFKPLAFSENITVDQMDVADFSSVNGYRVPMRQLQFSGNSSIGSNMELATLNGKQNIQIGNITVLGISLDKLVAQLDSTIGHTGSNSGDIVHTLANSAQVIQAVNNMKAEIAKASSPAARDLNQKTNLGNFSANVAINNGLVNPSAFKLNGPSVGLNGSGSVNLAGSKALNYKTNSQLLVNGINPIFKKLTFPATISGTIAAPSASLDWGLIQQQLLKLAFENNKQQIQQNVKQQINNIIGNPQQGNPNNQQQNKAVDAVSQGVTNAIGKLFGN